MFRRPHARPLTTYLGLLLSLSLSLASAAPSVAAPLFDDSAPLDITLRGPFEKIEAERDKDAEYEASLSFVDDDGQPVTLDAKLSVRGHYRLQKEVCTRSPLWVNLKKSQVKDTLFRKQDKLKLVTQCRNVSRYAEYVYREQQAYALFEALSEISFGSRLLNVTYVDSDSGAQETQPAFFIQHKDRVAKEHGMRNFEENIADKERLDPQQSDLVALFMYFLSNTDYSLLGGPPGQGCCHNIKMLEDDAGGLFPVPYDFDSTGYVNPPYAAPAGDIGQRDVNQRIYRGFCAPDTVTVSTVARFQERRPALEAIALDDTYVAKKSVRRARNNLKRFYDVIDDPKRLQREIVDSCR